MKEPILSREEVLEIAARLGSQSLNVTRVHELNGPTRTIFDDAGLEEFAAAVLARVCGEPIKWQARIPGGEWFDIGVALVERIREEGSEVRALYAINRSKS
ncbi:hypothetical protein [Burkholderia vietnamiensis]|uniref:hypothetical protein n=1 Tax=Burkholderia vietnamiensis TaxID=60552 RepID=UPI001B8ED189|nr:hypothetical protein [Burkholderia vietnamiensis]MBR8147034.1 hypothetical protein [Burkholderia vietnamiensis]